MNVISELKYIGAFVFGLATTVLGWAAPLHEAAARGDDVVVLRLLEKGAKIDAVNRDGETALSRAVYSMEDAVVVLLLEKGANPNLSLNVEDVFERVCARGKDAIADAFIRRGIKLDLTVSAALGRIATFSYLVSSGPEGNPFKEQFGDALAAGCAYGQFEVVQLLLSQSVDPNNRSQMTAPALIAAAATGQAAMCEMLCAAGAAIDIQDKDGRTALYWALRGACIESAIVLINRGASFQPAENSLEEQFAQGVYDKLKADTLWAEPSGRTEAQRRYTSSSVTLGLVRTEWSTQLDGHKAELKRMELMKKLNSFADRVADNMGNALFGAMMDSLTTKLLGDAGNRQLVQAYALRNAKTPSQYYSIVGNMNGMSKALALRGSFTAQAYFANHALLRKQYSSTAYFVGSGIREEVRPSKERMTLDAHRYQIQLIEHRLRILDALLEDIGRETKGY